MEAREQTRTFGGTTEPTAGGETTGLPEQTDKPMISKEMSSPESFEAVELDDDHHDHPYSENEPVKPERPEYTQQRGQPSNQQSRTDVYMPLTFAPAQHMSNAMVAQYNGQTSAAANGLYFNQPQMPIFAPKVWEQPQPSIFGHTSSSLFGGAPTTTNMFQTSHPLGMTLGQANIPKSISMASANAAPCAGQQARKRPATNSSVAPTSSQAIPLTGQASQPQENPPSKNSRSKKERLPAKPCKKPGYDKKEECSSESSDSDWGREERNDSDSSDQAASDLKPLPQRKQNTAPTQQPPQSQMSNGIFGGSSSPSFGQGSMFNNQPSFLNQQTNNFSQPRTIFQTSNNAAPQPSTSTSVFGNVNQPNQPKPSNEQMNTVNNSPSRNNPFRQNTQPQDSIFNNNSLGNCLFGSNPSPSFGFFSASNMSNNRLSSTNLFANSNPNTGIFENPGPSTNIFAQNSSPGSGSLFSNTNNTGIFGGNHDSQKQQQSSRSFGNTYARPNSNNRPSGTGLFGNANRNEGGLFGNNTNLCNSGCNFGAACPYNSYMPTPFGQNCYPSPFFGTVTVPMSFYETAMSNHQRIYQLEVENNRLRAANNRLERINSENDQEIEHLRRQHFKVLQTSRRRSVSRSRSDSVKRHRVDGRIRMRMVDRMQERSRERSLPRREAPPVEQKSQILLVKEFATVVPTNVFARPEAIKTKYNLKINKCMNVRDHVEALWLVILNRMIQTGTSLCKMQIENIDTKKGQPRVSIQTVYMKQQSKKDCINAYTLVETINNVKVCGDLNGYAIWQPSSIMGMNTDCEFKMEGYEQPLRLNRVCSNKVEVVLYPNYTMTPTELRRFCAKTGGKLQYIRDYDSCRQELRMLFTR